MSAEVVILASYAMVLVGVAHGLRALGRRSTSPWSSRALAGHVRATRGEPEPVSNEDWPHNEVPRLYAAMGLLASLAATALSITGLVLHPDGAALPLMLFASVLSAFTVWRMTTSLRG